MEAKRPFVGLTFLFRHEDSSHFMTYFVFSIIVLPSMAALRLLGPYSQTDVSVHPGPVLKSFEARGKFFDALRVYLLVCKVGLLRLLFSLGCI